MKSLILLLTLSSVAFAGQVCQYDNTQVHCAGCESNLQSGLAEVKGIQKVAVDLSTKVISVTFDEKEQNKDSVLEAIKKTGYDKTTFKSCSKADKNS